MQTPAFQLLTTTRFDPALTAYSWNDDDDDQPSPFFLLRYHFDRLQDAAAKHGWSNIPHQYPTFKAIVRAAVTDDNKSAFRLRIVQHQTGSPQVTAMPLNEPFQGDPFTLSLQGPDVDTQNPLTIHLDKQPVTPSIYTSTKTTFRQGYDDARTRCGIPPLTTVEGRASDVVLYNNGGLIMETSIFNVAFFRSGRWITPAASTGCLPGVARRFLLEQGHIVEDENALMVKDIIDGELILIFNGVQGCRIGRISLT